LKIVTYAAVVIDVSLATPPLDAFISIILTFDPKKLGLIAPMLLVPEGLGEFGDSATTAAGSVVEAAVLAAFTAVVFVPSVSLNGHAFPTVVGVDPC
jgi:hypothetical protein